MNSTKPTDQIIAQGRAMVRAIEAIGIIEPSGWFERWQARLLQAIYQHRLNAILRVAPSWMAEEILSASEHSGEDRAAVWVSEG